MKLMRSPTEFASPIVGIGAQKAGTTSVAFFLRANGMRVPPSARWGKELHWFSQEKKSFDNQVRGYRKILGGHESAGEFTPDYLYSSRSLLGVARAFPDARIVLFLRNPVDRFISGVEHGRSVGKLPRQLSARQILERSFSGEQGSHWESTLLLYGTYVAPVRSTLSLFALERVFLSFFEHWVNPTTAIPLQSSLLRFAGLESQVVDFPYGSVLNSSREKLQRAGIEALDWDDECRGRLFEYYDRFKPSLEAEIGKTPW